LCVIGLAAAVVLSPAQAADDAKLIADGKALFQSKICFTCHQVDENVPAPAGIAMKAPKFIGGFWGKKRTVTLGYGGPDATVTFDEAYFAESVRKPMDKVSKEAAAPMPPPPAVNDEEMKALIAYVRSLSEGGSAEDPNGLIAKGKINNFTYAAYKGSWNKLPDFSKLKRSKPARPRAAPLIPAWLAWARTLVSCSRATSRYPRRATIRSTWAPTMARAYT
jgi:cytochrome c551/c552